MIKPLTPSATKEHSCLRWQRLNCLLLFCLGGYWCMAQSPYSGEIPKVSPVSPNSAALFKVTQRPVGSYTGTTPINIPLYTISSGSITVPVTLNYSNGGIRVEEVASSVGLGFSLSAGGRITRVVNGTADDVAGYGGFLHGTLPPSNFPGSPWLPNIDYICRNELDVEPDLYYFDCNGLSGKFYFDESGVVHLVSQMPVHIEPVWKFVPPQGGNQILGWIIKDSRGTKYYFGMNKDQTVTYVDYTTSSYSSVNNYTNTPTSPGYSSAWHLAEIYDMTEENTITFTYENGASQFETLSGAYMRTSGMSGFDCLPSDSYGDEVMVTTFITEKILKRITGPNGYIEFTSSSNRMDLGGYQLDDVKLYKNGDVLQSRFHFNYGYFASPGANSGNDAFRKRLKLISLAQYGSSGPDALTHTFDYIETEMLPSRLSRATDYWGFYNGQNSNWTFLPNGYYEHGVYSSRRDNLADRRAYPAYSSANTLRKITYPTGGTREFIYEGNQALREYQSQVQADNQYFVFNQIGADDQQFDYNNTYNYPNNYPYFPVYQENFTVNSTDNGATFNYYLQGISGSGEYRVRIVRIVGPGSEFEVMAFIDQMNASYELPNGDYRLELYFTFTRDFTGIDAYWKDLNLSSEITYRYNEPYRRNNVNVGGIRVQEIRDYDPVTNKTNTTRYEYNIFTDATQAGLSSGMLVSPVRVAHVGGCQPMNRDCMYVRLSSSSAYPLSTESGSYVVYPEVRTIEDGNGYIDREYSFAFDAAASSINIEEFPIKPFQDLSWQRNKLVVEDFYDDDDNLVRKTRSRGLGVYSSEWGPPNPPPPFSTYMPHSQIGWKVVGYYDGHVCSGGVICMACWNQYSMTSFFTATTDVEEIDYTPQGDVKTLTEYTYYTDKVRPLAKTQKTYLSNGDIKETRYKYAFNPSGEFELPISPTEIQNLPLLTGDHYLEPLEVTVYLTRGGQTSFVEGSKYIFDHFNGKRHLAAVRRYTTLQDYTEVALSQYDGNGNLAERYRQNDVKEAYLWGYNGQYPVARVTGSSHSAIAALVNSNVLENPANDLQLRNELNQVRTSLAGSVAQVITYTYDPHVGMTSMTDANNVTTYFEYDEFARLKLIRDAQGNIMKRSSYQYSSPANPHNLIREEIIQVKNITDPQSIASLDIGEKAEIINYFDGLGRPMQTVNKQASPQGMDVVQPVIYDDHGRERVKYLPYAAQTSDGSYKSNPVGTAGNYNSSPHYVFYHTTGKVEVDDKPYAETIFEPSPLNRPLEQGAPGVAWQPDATHSYSSADRTVKMAYHSNGANEVLRWTYTAPASADSLGLVNASTGTIPVYYDANELYKTKTKDEQHHEVIVYTDKEGRTIFKRVQAVTGTPAVNDVNYAGTYYVYDPAGNLVCVLPPEAVRSATQVTSDYFGKSDLEKSKFLQRWAFRYAYDHKNRMIIKQVPGAKQVYMLYDERDRLVMTQDGNQRTLSVERPVAEWTFTKYDALNRPVLTGTYASNAAPATLQNDVNSYYSTLVTGKAWFETYIGSAAGNVLGYDNLSFPQVSDASRYLTVTYYDVYDAFIKPSGYEPVSQNLPGEQTAATSKVSGQITAMRVKDLTGGGWLRTVHYYDDRYRLIHAVADHQKGTVRTSNVYDFTGRLLYGQRKYVVNAVETTVREIFTYDHAGRLLATRHSINGSGDVVISANAYNALGQLVSKGLHSTNFPPVDPQIGQPGVIHASMIERDDYSVSETSLIATNQIRLTPGYHVPSGSYLNARIGFTEAEAVETALASGRFSQVVDYRYNIRGWLKRINHADVGTIADGNSDYDFFGMELAYQNTFGGLTSTPAFNGNISAMRWSKGYGASVAMQAYTFAYDPMNRLKDALHFDYNSTTTAWLSNNNGYGESQAYDLNGNIKTLVRKGYMGMNLDNLEYQYIGNLLNYVHDTGDASEGFVNLNTGADDYAYDQNGNLFKDRNKGINNNGDIRYNHLNLPREVIKGTESIQYLYDATGRKLAQEVYSNTGTTLVKRTDYIGELVFEGTPGTLQFVQHSEGRSIKDGNKWEYQYHMKDHLGNIRLSFTTKPPVTANYTANMETGQYGSGEVDFDNYNSYVNNAMDHTDAGTVYERVHELNGGYHGRVGMTTSFVVMPGDQISASVYARYSDLTSNANNNPFAADLAHAFEVSSGSVGEMLKLYNGLMGFAALVPQGNHPEDDDNAPKAFITVLLFDNDYNLLDATWRQVTTNAASSHDLLSVSIKAQEPGFAYFFLSNEHPYDVRVFFDDLTLTHTPSPIFSASDYYPFGLSYNSYTRENSVHQDYKFNGKEEQNELDLNWLDYGMRMYQSEIARWNGIDPLAEKYFETNPMTYVANNPVLFVDPNGAEIWLSFTYRNENDEEVTRRYQYKGGKLYNEDGDEYDGSDGADPIFQLVKDQLNSTKEQFGDNEKISDLFSFLESEESGEHTINIVLKGENSTTGSKNTTITYNPFQQEDPDDFDKKNKKEYDPRIGLIHEMRHSYGRAKGEYDGLTDWTYEDTGKTRLFSQYEARAVNTENILRLSLYGTRRTTYPVLDEKGKVRRLKIPSRYITN